MPAATAPRHQHLIISVFGLYRGLRGGIPIAALIRMLGELGVEAAGVRSSVSRLKKRGILASTQLDGAAGYALTPQFEEVFTEGDQRIFGRHSDTSDQWLLATFTVPESQRHLRHRIRAVLGRWGFGSVAPGLWIAPVGVAGAVRSRLIREELDGYVEFFTAQYCDADELKNKVARWWDLDLLDRQYQTFVSRYGAARTDTHPSPRDAFVAYVPLVTQWRQLPYLDPGLPDGLLPQGWHGRTAEALFRRLHRRWSGLSRQYAERLLSGR